MQFLYEIGGEYEELVSRVKKAVFEDGSLENLILNCLEERLALTFIMADSADDNVMVVTVENDGDGSDEEHIALITYPSKEWKTCGQFDPLDTAVNRFADQEGSIPNIEWFDKRNERLQVRADPCTGVVVAPPAAISELIISYLLTERGIVSVRREVVETKTGRTCAALMRLRSMPAQTEEVFQEDIAASLRKLRVLVEKRQAEKASREGREILPDLFQ